jgi:hypothetical protein
VQIATEAGIARHERMGEHSTVDSSHTDASSRIARFWEVAETRSTKTRSSNTSGTPRIARFQEMTTGEEITATPTARIVFPGAVTSESNED